MRMPFEEWMLRRRRFLGPALRGEVAERLKAAVCQGRQESQNGPEIDDFRPVFIGTLVSVGCRMMVLGLHVGTLVGTLRTMPRWALPRPCPLQCKALQLQCTIGGPSWTIRSRSGCPPRWVVRFGEHRVASDAARQTSFAWRSKHSCRERRRPTARQPNARSTSSARCRLESRTWRNDIGSTSSLR